MNVIDCIVQESELKNRGINMVNTADLLCNELNKLYETLEKDPKANAKAIEIYHLFYTWHELYVWVAESGETTGHSTAANRTWLSNIAKQLDDAKKIIND